MKVEVDLSKPRRIKNPGGSFTPDLSRPSMTDLPEVLLRSSSTTVLTACKFRNDAEKMAVGAMAQIHAIKKSPDLTHEAKWRKILAVKNETLEAFEALELKAQNVHDMAEEARVQSRGFGTYGDVSKPGQATRDSEARRWLSNLSEEQREAAILNAFQVDNSELMRAIATSPYPIKYPTVALEALIRDRVSEQTSPDVYHRSRELNLASEHLTDGIDACKCFFEIEYDRLPV